MTLFLHLFQLFLFFFSLSVGPLYACVMPFCFSSVSLFPVSHSRITSIKGERVGTLDRHTCPFRVTQGRNNKKRIKSKAR